MQDDTNSMIDAIKQGIENNSSDAPALSIDPKSQQVSVVGDPNKVNETRGEYKLTFTYPESELTEEDKVRMRKSEISEGEYEADITYYGKRVRPIHRTTIAMNVADIFVKMGVITEDGSYNTDSVSRTTARIFLSNIDVVADIAKKVLDIPDEQMQYVTAESLVQFFLDMLNNEPNLIKESATFLEPSLIRQLLETTSNETTQQQNTQQN